MSDTQKPEPIKKVSIIVSKGTLEGVYPALIMANGARMEGIEVNLFFTFFGMEAILKEKMNHLHVSTVGNPALHIPTMIGGLPGVSALVTHFMKKEMEKIDIPPVSEFIEIIHDSGAEIYTCLASVDMFHLKKEDFCEQVDGIITVGEFYEKSAGSSIIFT